jgi:GMP synthase-like glutamine amidotransferase
LSGGVGFPDLADRSFMRVTFLSILGEPGTFDPSVYDDWPGGADECRWVFDSFSYLPDVKFAGVKVAEGEAVPAPGTADAFILGGSYNSVHDGFEWQDRIYAWLADLQAAGKPLLGICGGHQMMGRFFGSQVVDVPSAPVAGTLPVRLTEAGKRSSLFAGLDGVTAFHFANNEHVDRAPDGAACLAESDDVHVAALDYGKGWYSVQFHPEAESGCLARSWRNSRPEFGPRYRDTSAGKTLIENFLRLGGAGV